MENLKHTYKSVYKELRAAEEYLEHGKEYKEKGDAHKAELLFAIAISELAVAEKVIHFFEQLQEDYDDMKQNPLYKFQVECMVEEYNKIKEKLSKR